MSLIERLSEGRLVYYRTARRVDQISRPLHFLESLGAEQVLGFGRQWAMQRDVIRRPDQLVQLDAAHVGPFQHVIGHVGIIRDHLHPECLGLGRNQLRNLAECHQSQHGSPQAMNRNHRPHLPFPRLRARIRRRDLADQRQQQRHGVVGHFVQAIIRDLRDHDALAGGDGDVHVVHADAEPRDHAALGHLRDHLASDLGIRGQNRVGVARHAENPFRRRLRCEPQLAADLR